MKNHKWGKAEGRQKVSKCERCGISREWHFSDYQCWYYFLPAYGYGAVVKGQYQRPKCEINNITN